MLIPDNWKALNFHGNVYFLKDGWPISCGSVSLTNNKWVHNLGDAYSNFLKDIKSKTVGWYQSSLIDEGALDNDRGFWFLTLDSVSGPHSMRYQSHFLHVLHYQKPSIVTLRFELFGRELNMKEQEIWPMYMKMAASFEFD